MIRFSPFIFEFYLSTNTNASKSFYKLQLYSKFGNWKSFLKLYSKIKFLKDFKIEMINNEIFENFEKISKPIMDLRISSHYIDILDLYR